MPWREVITDMLLWESDKGSDSTARGHAQGRSGGEGGHHRQIRHGER